MAFDLVANAVERMQHAAVEGWCDQAGADELGVGSVDLTVRVNIVAGACNCTTGYFASDMGFIEAEEIE